MHTESILLGEILIRTYNLLHHPDPYNMFYLLFLIGSITASNLRFREKGTISNLWNLDATICYGVIFDAGSTGTRVYVYSWNCRETQTMPYISLSEASIEKKVKPGISTFATKIGDLNNYLQPLIEFAKTNIPPKMIEYTPIMLGATAGMRLLPEEDQNRIMNEIRRIFTKSGFLYLSDQWARVITGMEEGAYMWLSINYILNKMASDEQVLTIDLGGASTQISFRPKSEIEENYLDLIIPNLNEYEIYSTSYLFYGMDQALIQIHKQFANNETKIITTPCYFSGYENIYEHDKTFTVIGTGNYQECDQVIKEYLNNDKDNCKHTNCAINGQYQPIIDSDIIYGISGIQSMVELFNYENFTLTQYGNKVRNFAGLTWDDIKQIPEYINNPYITTDYFSSIYVYELLSYGYGIPQNQIIHSPDTIYNITPAWTVAALFFQLAQIQCQYDSPICVSFIK